ncbi:hypothetical protein EV198_3677 [Roseivirga ehrenbergii]|uniref:DUF6973 domain-containing protein n=1 Tax=Roseivirga ehrenbergii (strain DSM 102268 / JCM 13514 / KCTC 12282 / NCIMB 14502 / KMM 6017) TaxID=279360 RepID=A0A150XK04_ROSEK|nr:hypothetical protein [Roseivirga ehrenbergii]KYG79059.1 hypothetical protein MB14_17260 [Roseivirga ehrenbergii]TCK99144.1 hypothetical protein EV198_3677 [Roseivirga ehrenbergii]
MKKQIYLTILLLSAIGLGLLGCSEEDIFETTEAPEVNSIISQFSPEAFSKVVSSDYKVDWNISVLLEHSEELGLDYYEFEISLSEKQVPITNKLYDTKQSLLAIKREGGKYDFYVAKYFMDRWKSEGKSVKDVSLSKMESFSGLLNVFDNNNQMVYAKKMDNGKLLDAPLSLNSDFSNGNIENRMVENCEVTATYHYIDSYLLSYENEWVYQYSELVNISYETECNLEYIPDLYLGGGGGSGTYYSQNGGGPYAGCGDSVRGCLYKIELEQDYRSQMSTAEIGIFDNMSTWNQALYLANAKQALNYVAANYRESNYNGKGDAIRHALFHALNTITIGESLSKQLGDAHENRPPNYSYEFKEVQMDLHNNRIGREWSNYSERGYPDILTSINAAFNSGELVYLSNLEGGAARGRATNSSQLIPTNL